MVKNQLPKINLRSIPFDLSEVEEGCVYSVTRDQKRFSEEDRDELHSVWRLASWLRQWIKINPYCVFRSNAFDDGKAGWLLVVGNAFIYPASEVEYQTEIGDQWVKTQHWDVVQSDSRGKSVDGYIIPDYVVVYPMLSDRRKSPYISRVEPDPVAGVLRLVRMRQSDFIDALTS